MKNRLKALWMRRALCVGLGMIAVLCVAEVIFRAVLFSETIRFPFIENPAMYVDADADDDYWVLYDRYSAATYRTKTTVQDPLLGWTQSNGGSLGVRSDTYYSSADVQGRPILFFGDSFVGGPDNPDEALPEILEDLLEGSSVLNYGVGGYGVDQIALRVKQKGTNFRERGALVLIGILLHDLDRSVLTFRLCQKPYYRLKEGELVLHHPAQVSNAAFLDDYKYHTRSFALAAVRRRVHYALRRETGNAGRRYPLNRAILSDLVGFLDTESIQAAFVILYAESSLAAHAKGRPSSRETELKSILANLGVVTIDTAPMILSMVREEGLHLSDLYDETLHFALPANRTMAQGLSEVIEKLDEKEE